MESDCSADRHERSLTKPARIIETLIERHATRFLGIEIDPAILGEADRDFFRKLNDLSF